MYRKVIEGVKRPRMPMPKVFNLIDSLMKNGLDRHRTEEIAPGMPPEELAYGERWVESRPLRVPGTQATVVFRGRFDVAGSFDDQEYGVVDFKTAEPRAVHIPLYTRQLHAYAWALEQPAHGGFGLTPVNVLGLLVFEPGVFSNGLESAT